MILDEIRKEALRLMFVNYEDDLDRFGWNTDNCANETYLQYIRNMRGCINRCFGIFERERCLLPKKLKVQCAASDNTITNYTNGVITLGNAEEAAEDAARALCGVEIDENTVRLDMDVLLPSSNTSVLTVPSFLSVDRVVFSSLRGYDSDVEYKDEGNVIILRSIEKDEIYTILYNWRIPRVPVTAAYDYVVDLPDYLCELIPYYIKAELFEEEEPRLAVVARNYFEAGLARVTRGDTIQKRVIDVFGGLF